MFLVFSVHNNIWCAKHNKVLKEHSGLDHCTFWTLDATGIPNCLFVSLSMSSSLLLRPIVGRAAPWSGARHETPSSCPAKAGDSKLFSHSQCAVLHASLQLHMGPVQPCRHCSECSCAHSLGNTDPVLFATVQKILSIIKSQAVYHTNTELKNKLFFSYYYGSRKEKTASRLFSCLLFSLQ